MGTRYNLAAFVKAVLFGVFISTPVSSAEPIEVRVLAKATDHSTTGNLVDIRNGDVLESKSHFRIEVRSGSPGHVTIAFHGSDGKITSLINSRPIEAGDALIAPDDNKWYVLDETPGTEKVLVKLQDSRGTISEITHQIIHIQGQIDYGNMSNFLAKIDPVGPTRAASGPASTLLNNLDVATVEKILREATASAGALNKLIPEDPLLLRGSAGASVYKSAAPAVVLLVADESIGSGSVISNDGLVLTNWHVVQGYESVAVIFKPSLGKKIQPTDVYRGNVKRIDAVADLALLKVIDPPKNLTVLKVGKLSAVEIGSDVHAIGHPTGESWSYTKGIISQVRPDYEWETSARVKHRATVIQTQTPISPGSSGGPLLTDAGILIGVNAFLKSTAQGLNFAVSAEDVQAFLASNQDRLPKLVSKPPPSCVPVYDKKDTNGNGVVDMIRVDTNCDGKPDLLIVDSNEDGKADVMYVDRNYDGELDSKVIPSKPGSPLDLWLIDTDGDGNPDVAGIDIDLDGKPDRYKKLSRSG